MRGSAVVQSLKSLASKLHPQLPLGPKESQKLFVALTTSFQNELDQAYPRQAADDDSTKIVQSSSKSKNGGKGIHPSSATLADRHLAAVLTNPLLAPRVAQGKRVLDLNTARAALTKDPTQDAVSLLEHYEDQGAATLPIAELCLQFHNRKIDSLPQAERQAFMTESAAGKRSLLWLWRSESYKDAHFLDKGNSFKTDLVLLLAREGEESFLVNCLREDRPPLGPVPNARLPTSWKRPFVRAIIEAKLLEHCYLSANAALDTLFMFIDWKKAAKHGATVPIAGAVMLLCLKLASNGIMRSGTDHARYDKFLQSLTTTHGHGAKSRLMYVRLCALHPKSPTPFPALKLLRSAFQSSTPDEEVRELLVNPLSEAHRLANGRFLVKIATQLQSHSRPEDAAWVLSLGQWLYPKEVFPEHRLSLHATIAKPGKRAEEIESLSLAPAA